MKRSRLLLALTSAASVLVTSPAWGWDSVEFDAAARLGSATSPGWIASPYGFGFGGHAGASVYGFYGGLSAMYYLGGTGSGAGFHTLLLGLEGGYTFKLKSVRLRPQVGVGSGTFSENVSDGVNNPTLTTSVGNVYVEPGLVLFVPVGPIFLGADANALLLPHFTLATPDPTPKTYVSFSAHGQIGVFF